MKVIQVAAEAHIDDDPAYCALSCPFLVYFHGDTVKRASCIAFDPVELGIGYRSSKPLRCLACMDNQINKDEGT